MSALFQPITFRSVQLKNRIVVSPMCQYSSQDGFANDWHLVHLGSRAAGGAALVIAEATAVTPEGRITPYDLGIWKDEHVAELKRITSFIESQGAVPGIQLAHAGRKASCVQPWNGGHYMSVDEGGWQPAAPSAIAFHEKAPVPHALSVAEIKNIIAAFKNAAQRALHAGFKLIELHGAHGYLIHEFLSPLSNQRTDEYGGSFENRIRFLLEIIAAVKEVWPDELPLFTRISATDWVTNGWSIEDSIQLAAILKEAGIDLIDCSSGGNLSKVSIPVKPGYQVAFAHAIKQQAGIATGAVGLITEAKQAEQIIQNGEADLVLLARELLRNPYFPLHAAKQLNAEAVWPLQYQRAK